MMEEIITYLLLMFGHTMVPVATEGYLNEDETNYVVAFACEAVGGDCPANPVIYFGPTRVGQMGYHWRYADWVVVTDRCLYPELTDYDQCMAVTIHEVVHYITDEQGRYPDRCDSEGIAWAVYNKYIVSAGRTADLYVYDWRVNYPECQEENANGTTTEVL